VSAALLYLGENRTRRVAGQQRASGEAERDEKKNGCTDGARAQDEAMRQTSLCGTGRSRS